MYEQVSGKIWFINRDLWLSCTLSNYSCTTFKGVGINMTIFHIRMTDNTKKVNVKSIIFKYSVSHLKNKGATISTRKWGSNCRTFLACFQEPTPFSQNKDAQQHPSIHFVLKCKQSWISFFLTVEQVYILVSVIEHLIQLHEHVLCTKYFVEECCTIRCI